MEVMLLVQSFLVQGNFTIEFSSILDQIPHQRTISPFHHHVENIITMACCWGGGGLDPNGWIPMNWFGSNFFRCSKSPKIWKLPTIGTFGVLNLK